jgi:flagellar biosynthesis protein FlhF
MEVYTFRADSLQAALQEVRRTLGPDASILNTREKRASRLGLFGRPVIEVDATSNVLQALRPPAESQSQTATTRLTATTQLATSTQLTATTQLAASTQAPHQSLLQSELMAGGMSEPVVAELLHEAERRWRASQLSTTQPGFETPADPTVQSQELRLGLKQLIEAQLNISGGIELKLRPGNEPLVVALAGPTGCGKTTSLAKIAAGLHLDEGYRVGLIALDTFRLGAVDQLLHYADWLSAPLEVVSSAEEVSDALQRLRSCDVVLLDTAGRAPRDHRQLSELRKFLELAQPDATHLVVSASSAVAHVEQTLRAFAEIKPTHLIITKLDESVGFGQWFSVLQACSLPISYLTFGQHVPQDIVAATSSRVSDWLVGAAQ